MENNLSITYGNSTEIELSNGFSESIDIYIETKISKKWKERAAFFDYDTNKFSSKLIKESPKTRLDFFSLGDRVTIKVKKKKKHDPIYLNFTQDVIIGHQIYDEDNDYQILKTQILGVVHHEDHDGNEDHIQGHICKPGDPFCTA
ncbi:MAG: hypothetical protein RLN81_15655 [Balneolaceae bacterium]